MREMQPDSQIDPSSQTALGRWTTRGITACIALLLVAASVIPVFAERAVVRKVPPNVPPLARQMHLSGTIAVTANVDAGGSVVSAVSKSGNKLLAPAAIEAVKQWKFAPGDASTETVEVTFAAN